MDYGTLDRWYAGLPPLVICNTASVSLGTLDRWYASLPPVIGADESIVSGASHTRACAVSLPSNDADLGTSYTEQDNTDIGSSNNVRVGVSGSTGYLLHEFKEDAGTDTKLELHCELQSSLAPSASTVYLQVYNRSGTPAWETMDYDDATGAATDFVLEAILTDLTNYKDGSNIVACRVYQHIV